MKHGLIGQFAKETTIDANGRITLSKKLRDHLKVKEGSKVKTYAFDTFAIVTTDRKNSELMSFEFLYNKIEQLQRQTILINERFAEFREMVINEVVSTEKKDIPVRIKKLEELVNSLIIIKEVDRQ